MNVRTICLNMGHGLCFVFEANSVLEKGTKMISSDRKCVMGAVLVIAFAGPMACRPSNSEMSSVKGIAVRTVLSKEQIIGAANLAARRAGRDPVESDVQYDEGNVRWRQVVLELSPPKLENGRFIWPDGTFEKNIRRWAQLKWRDYQAVSYWHKRAIVNGRELPRFEGGTWVLVDRETGRVLLVYTAP